MTNFQGSGLYNCFKFEEDVEGKMTIYLDIVFVENVIINYIILISTSIMSKHKIKHITLLLSSSIGGLYAILNYILPMNILENILVKIFFIKYSLGLFLHFNNTLKSCIRQEVICKTYVKLSA